MKLIVVTSFDRALATAAELMIQLTLAAASLTIPTEQKLYILFMRDTQQPFTSVLLLLAV